MAALITPPDVVSQIGLAIPIIILYELSIVGARLIEKKGAQKYDDDDYEDIGPEPDNPTA